VKTKQRPAFALGDTLAVHGIRKNPFPIDEADDLFFSTPTLRKQIDGLRNLVQFGDLLLVVSGAEGAGKTTFLNQFVLSTDKRWHCCRIDARVATTLDSLMGELLRGFGLTAPDDQNQDVEALLCAHLADLRASDEIALVTVDDAQLLTRTACEFLLDLAQPRDDIRLFVGAIRGLGRIAFEVVQLDRVVLELHVSRLALAVKPDLDLVLAGSAVIPVPDHPRIHHVGRISEEEKVAALGSPSEA